MKPRFRRLISNALPTLIIVPAFVTVAPAAVLNVSSLGSIEILSGYNAADSIRANGGSNPTAPLTVTIAQNATLTGDSVFEDGIRVTTSGYTIDNFGSLSTTLRDGIRFTVNEGKVNNSGSIEGDEHGVRALDGFYLKNLFVADPVESEPDSEPLLITGTQAEITATDGHAIKAGNEAEIINEGKITSTSGDGINVGDDASVENNEVYDENFEETVVSGEITGDRNGITAGTGLVLTNERNATIRGTNGDGVNAEATAKIVNEGSIFGSIDGIEIDHTELNTIVNQGISSISVGSLH